MTNQKTPVQGGVTEEQIEYLEAKVADTLAYYQCRETNPKADHPRMGYHAFPDDQREHLRAQKGEAAAEIVRMMISRPSDQHRAWEQGVKDAVSAISDSMGTLTYVAPHNPFSAFSVSASAHPAEEHHDVEEREAESDDHAATVTGDREKLIAESRSLENSWRKIDRSFSEIDFMDSDALAELHATAFVAVHCARRLAAALAVPVEVDRAHLRKLIAPILSNSMNYPEPHHMLGQPLGKLEAALLDALEAGLRGEGQ